MLLRHEISDAVEVLTVTGPVTDRDAEPLRAALQRGLDVNPRGIVVDLTAAGPFAPAALRVLDDMRRAAPGWPRPALVLCGMDAEAAALLDAPVHGERSEAVAHVDDRSAAPRRVFGLEHGPGSPSVARAAVSEACGQLDLQPLSDDLQLVVSELVTNAVRYAEPPVELEIEVSDDAVTVAVVDGSPGRPVPQGCDDPDAEGGRGLHLVDLLAAESGVRPQPPGKAIWASLPR